MASTAGASSRRAAAPERLPGFASGRVTEIQRVRIVDAMTRACVQRGAANVTVSSVVDGSGVSRRTFYEHFRGLEACLLESIDDALRRASEPVLEAYRSTEVWCERLRSALIAFLHFAEDEPFAARLLVLETLGSGVPALQRRRRVLEELAMAVDEGRREARAELPPLTADGVVGGVLAVLHTRLSEARTSSLVELTGHIMGIVTLPYLGAAAARKELDRPLPEPLSTPVQPRAGVAGALRDTEMRLTYRTVRALAAVAAEPDASNRDLALVAGVHDQGQISKLLTRLERLELIENHGAGHARGGSNAWRLTPKGAEMHRALGERERIVPGSSVGHSP